jgi:hypothetical protein
MELTELLPHVARGLNIDWDEATRYAELGQSEYQPCARGSWREASMLCRHRPGSPDAGVTQPRRRNVILGSSIVWLSGG